MAQFTIKNTRNEHFFNEILVDAELDIDIDDSYGSDIDGNRGIKRVFIDINIDKVFMLQNGIDAYLEINKGYYDNDFLVNLIESHLNNLCLDDLKDNIFYLEV